MTQSHSGAIKSNCESFHDYERFTAMSSILALNTAFYIDISINRTN